ADVDPAGDGDELGFGLVLELPPALVCAPQEGDVLDSLEVGLADDPGAAVRRALIVGRPEPLEAEYREAALGKGIRCSATHGAEADHDDVGGGHVCSILWEFAGCPSLEGPAGSACRMRAVNLSHNDSTFRSSRRPHATGSATAGRAEERPRTVRRQPHRS